MKLKEKYSALGIFLKEIKINKTLDSSKVSSNGWKEKKKQKIYVQAEAIHTMDFSSWIHCRPLEPNQS